MSPSPNEAQATDPILWDVVEEHLDEADFLFGQWTRALDSPRFTLAMLAKGPEARLLAQLDGLLVNGPSVVTQVLEPAALAPASPRPARATAAALALLGHGRQDLVVRAALGADPVASAGAQRALQLAAHPSFDDWLVRTLADSSDAQFRLTLLRIAAGRRVAIPNLLLAMQSADTAEAVAAIEAARWSPGALHLPVLEYLVDDPRPDVAQAALITALVLGSQHAFARCLARASDPTIPDSTAMLLVALLGTPAQHRALVEHVQRDKHRAGALFALGYTGQAAVVPALLSQLEAREPTVAKLAVEAVATITGLDSLADAFVLPEPASEETELPPLQEDLARDLVSTMADELPTPNVVAIRSWWQANETSFEPGRRLLLGSAWTPEQAVNGLRDLPLRRRHPLALWWLISSGGRVRIDSRAFSQLQRAHIAAAANTPSRITDRRYGSW